jgi:hypothetical protein
MRSASACELASPCAAMMEGVFPSDNFRGETGRWLNGGGSQGATNRARITIMKRKLVPWPG